MIVTANTSIWNNCLTTCSGNSVTQDSHGYRCASCGTRTERLTVRVDVVDKPDLKKREPAPFNRKHAAYTPKVREGFRVFSRPEFHARSNPRR